MPLDQEVLLRHLLTERARLLGYIRSIVRDRHIAEDVFQEVSILAVRKIDEIPSRSALPGWLRRAARFEGMNALRKRQREPVSLSDDVLDLLEPEWAESEKRTGSDELMGALEQCMNQISDYARRLLALRHREDLTGDDLAHAAGRSKNTVYVALSRTHAALAHCIEHRMSGQGGSV